MSQDDFRKMMATPRAHSATPRVAALGMTPRRSATSTMSSAFLKPALPSSRARKPTPTINLSGKKREEKLTTDDGYRDRAAERRAGVDTAAPDVLKLGETNDEESGEKTPTDVEDSSDSDSDQDDDRELGDTVAIRTDSVMAQNILKHMTLRPEVPQRNAHFEPGRMVFCYDWSESRYHHTPTTVLRSQKDLSALRVRNIN